MILLLDTNICIAFLNGQDSLIKDRSLTLSSREVAICSVVKAELLYGARNSQHVAPNLSTLSSFFAELTSLPFDDVSAESFGVIRAQLQKSGTLVGANDMMIASIALASDATLVTGNQQEFRRVGDLRVETW